MPSWVNSTTIALALPQLLAHIFCPPQATAGCSVLLPLHSRELAKETPARESPRGGCQEKTAWVLSVWPELPGQGHRAVHALHHRMHLPLPWLPVSHSTHPTHSPGRVHNNMLTDHSAWVRGPQTPWAELPDPGGGSQELVPKESLAGISLLRKAAGTWKVVSYLGFGRRWLPHSSSHINTCLNPRGEALFPDCFRADIIRHRFPSCSWQCHLLRRPCQHAPTHTALCQNQGASTDPVNPLNCFLLSPLSTGWKL